MDLKRLLPDCILVIFLVYVHCGISLVIDEDYEDGPASFSRCPWIRNKLKNGRVKYRYRGRVAKFVCDAGYDMAGKRSSTCVAGQWSNPLPVCVARGCKGSTTIENGHVTELFRGALFSYECNPGYSLEGPSSIHCDGRRWNTSPPLCSVATETPETSCDFENPDFCGWTHDPNHDFDWRRNQFATPSGHAGTGPSFDHTFGENKGGYYLYIEASTPRKLNDKARIFSPVYFPSQSGGCFLFWYHMFGATTGGLRVYLKPESHVLDELPATWEKFGDQGNQWLRGTIDIPVLHENFQIVIEGIRGESYVGDSAIDDVSLSTNSCVSMENETETTEKTLADSCRGRCREADSGSLCGCNDNCSATRSCCRDYRTLCYEVPGNDTAGANTDEPGDFYGKTTTPTTVTEYVTTVSNNDVKLSSTTSDATSMTSTGFHITTPSTTSTNAPTLNISTTLASVTFTSPTTSSTTAASSTPSPSSTSITTSSSTSSITEKGTTLARIPISTATTLSSERTKETTTKLTTTPTTTTSTTPIPTTLSSTTTEKSTTTSSSTTSTAQTTPVAPKIPLSTTKITSSTTKITPQLLTTLSSETDKTIDVRTTTTITPVRITESTQTSSYADTTFSSTRKTYNLRPRSTTPLSVSTVRVVTDSSTTSISTISSTTAQVERVTTATPSSSQPNTIGYNFPLSKSSTVTLSSIIITPSTIIPTTKTTTSSTKEYTTISSPTSKRNPTQKFSFLTSTSSPLQDRIDQQNASKSQTTPSNSSVPIVASVITILLITVAAGVVYYLRKNKNKRQSKLSDDSEMRFLEENEYMEYSDASALNKILTK